VFFEWLESRRLLSASLPVYLLRFIAGRTRTTTTAATATGHTSSLAHLRPGPHQQSASPRALASAVVAAATPALTFDSTSGLLQIIGTPGPDRILLTQSGASLSVNVNGKASGVYATTAVAQISIDAGAGDDYVKLDPAISVPATIRGGAGNDTLIGSAANDLLIGGSGDDLLMAVGGNNTLQGGVGNDTLIPGSGNDVLDGGAGFDTADFSARSDNLTLAIGGGPVSGAAGQHINILSNVERVIGGSGDDMISVAAGATSFLGNPLGYVLDGGPGDDTLVPGLGPDTLVGGPGEDTVDFSARQQDLTIDLRHGQTNSGAAGQHVQILGVEDAYGGSGKNLMIAGDTDSVLIGGPGNDTLIGGAGNDVLKGMGGNDLIIGNGGSNLLDGGAGDDTIYGGAAPDAVVAAIPGAATPTPRIVAPGDNFILGGDGNDLIFCGDGHDAVSGGDGNDTIYGGAGGDNLAGNNGDDVIHAGTGNDSIDGGSGNDTIYGGPGNDTLLGGDGNDLIIGQPTSANGAFIDGGTGNDTLYGTSGDDTILGGDGNDVIYGVGTGDKHLSGGLGNDTIYGGLGNDTIDGGFGNDSLVGGPGNDTFINLDGDQDTIDGGGGFNIAEQDTFGNDLLTNIQMIYDPAPVNPTATPITPPTIEGPPPLGTSAAAVVAGAPPYPASSFAAPPLPLQVGVRLTERPAGPFVAAPAATPLAAPAATTVAVSLVGGILRIAGTPGNDRIIVSQDSQNIYINANGAPALAFPAASVVGVFADGGAGNDLIECQLPSGANPVRVNATLHGGAGNDTLIGGAGNDQLFGDAGNDSLAGGLGDDYLNGGAGDDTLNGGLPDQFYAGGDGNDTFVGGGGFDTLDYSHRTANLVIRLDKTSSNNGGPGEHDTIFAGDIANVWGGSGNDYIVGNALANYLSGGAGNDTIFGLGGIDDIEGGYGNDLVYGGNESNFIYIYGDGAADQYNTGGNQRLVAKDPFDVMVPPAQPI
jgi:Ca2+-binding RTX toxin-like protein